MKTFNKILSSLMLFAFLAMTGCSSEYDDSKLKKELENLKSRIEALETKVNNMNSEISALKKIVDENVTIVKVEENADGYTIFFSDNTTATIKHGAPGENAPVIGVKKDTDDVYYWTITQNGTTEWLLVDGEKLRVTGESVKPLISIDSEGYWIISYDNDTTSVRILDADGNPVSAITENSNIGGLFNSITYDDNNVYFELSDGTIVTVPIRSDFYMLIRKAPEVSTFTYGETQVYEVEEVGVNKTIITKPDGWKVTYIDNKLTIKAPVEEIKGYVDLEGTVSVIYFSSNGQSDAVVMDVVVEADFTGVTTGADFAVNVTEITDKKMSAEITPNDKNMYWYVGYSLKEKIDTEGTDFLFTGSNSLLSMLGFYSAMGWLDNYAYKGDKSDFSLSTGLNPGTEYYAVVFGFEADPATYSSTLKTEILLVPFKTKQPVVINTVYRINVSDVSWYGAKYSCVPSDDLGYFHGFIPKTEFDSYEDDAAFMKSRIDIYLDMYRQELLYDRTMTWDDLTYKGTQNVVAPIWDFDNKKFHTPLVDDTEYYIYAFSCTDGDASSPLSKASFKTGKFNATENCTFDISTVVNRQDVEVTITPSNSNVTYISGIVERKIFEEFDTPLQFAVHDLVYSKAWLKANGHELSDIILKGKNVELWENEKAATGYVAYVYGCSEDGILTTSITTHEFVTKGTIDGIDAPKHSNKGIEAYKRAVLRK